MKRGRTPIRACGPFLFLLLASCGSDEGKPTAEQNRQLANADALLNSAPDSLSNIDENALGPAERNSSSDAQ
jgi:hypothetical protein